MSEAQQTSAPKARHKKAKIRTGLVVSDGAAKTRTVEVTRLVQHPMYKKFVRRRSRFHFHDEQNESKNGDMVEVRETRPLSKTKRWTLVRVVVKGKSV